MRKSCFVIGDSVPLPRGATLPVAATWPYRLQERFHEAVYFVNVCVGGATSDELSSLVQRNTFYYRPDLAVAHFGVVDSAPRTLLPHEKAALDKMLGIPKVMERIFREHHAEIASARGVTFVSLDRFIDNCAAIFGRLATLGCRTLALPIQPACYRFAEAAPTFNEVNRPAYNEVIQKTVEAAGGVYLSEVELPEGAFLLDGHHLNMIGHGAVCEAIAARLDGILATG